MTDAEAGPAALDERILGAGTNARFALLLVLLVASSGSMLLPVLFSLNDGNFTACNLAAGVDIEHAAELGSNRRMTGQALAYLPCVARYDPPLPWWQILIGPAVVLVVAAVTMNLLPRWKQRAGRCVRLDLIDDTGAIAARVGELAAGRVDQVPALFVAPAALSRSGAVFGTNRRPRLRLNAGLVACRDTHPRVFDAVVLHELGHVANRDLTVTYSTVALWRTFLALVVCPDVLWSSWTGAHVIAARGAPVAAGVSRYLILPAVTAVVMSVVRADVLRSRELHADLTARRWGAPLEHVWAAMPAMPVRGGRRALRWADAAADLVRAHPRWEVRRDALADPAPLFAVSALLMFLIGVTATLTNYHLLGHFTPHMAMMSGWLTQAVGAVPAAVVSASTVLLLWRAVARAAVLGLRAPTGLRSGLWLGSGLVVGSLLNGQSTGDLWLPRGWWALALVVAAAAGFTCWTTQCARLAAASWPGRSLRLPLALCLIAGWLILATWFVWWDFYGAMFANGAWFETAGIRQGIVHWFPGTGAVHPDTTAVMAQTLPVLRDAVRQPLAPVAVVSAWVVPLVLWAAGQAVRARGRLGAHGRADMDRLSDGAATLGWRVPPLRRAVGAALGGGALAVLGVGAVQAWLHALHAGADQRGGLYAFSYAIWSLAAIVLGSAAAAAIATTAPTFRLPAALIASGIATLLGLGGAVALISTDGCLRPLAVLNDSCAWRPAWRQLQGGETFHLLVHGALLLAPVTALLVTALATLARHSPRAAPPRLDSGPAGRRPTAASAFGYGTCAVALATATLLTVSDTHFQLLTPAKGITPATQAAFQQMQGLPVLPVSTEMRWRQVHAWYRLGGRYLLEHALADTNAMVTVLRPAVHDNRLNVTADLTARMRPLCADLRNVASWEPYYFQVPDPAAQNSWHQFGVIALSTGQRCTQAVDRADTKAFISPVTDLLTAAKSALGASNRVKAIINDPQDPVFTGPPVQPPQPRL
ncbi:M48 family metalloprotease [Streptomyces olivoreticuli]